MPWLIMAVWLNSPRGIVPPEPAVPVSTIILPPPNVGAGCATPHGSELILPFIPTMFNSTGIFVSIPSCNTIAVTGEH